MKLLPFVLNSRVVSALLCGATLAACGGQATSGATQSPVAADAQTLTLATVQSSTAVTPATASTSPPNLISIASAPITDVRLENTSVDAPQASVPFTFGQVFAISTLQPSVSLMGRLDDGTTIPLQVDVKATHANGSVRHAIISGVLPKLAAGATRTMSLVRNGAVQATGQATPDALLAAGFNASVRLNIGGVEYFVAADQLLKAGPRSKWLSGPTADEWQVSAPLATATGIQHPHLSARFAVRWYDSIKKARVDLTVENDWAYEPSPQNFTYDATVLVGAGTAYQKAGLNHLHHARWRKVFWWNSSAPEINIKHNTSYLIASRALPNFDQTLTAPEASLAALKARWTGAITEPMGVGLATPYMPTTGGRDDIGLLPSWTAIYLLGMDKRAKDVTLGTADLAGSWSSHYRDKNTGRPVSLTSYPYMTILGRPGDTYNPVTKKSESFPTCAAGANCDTSNVHDSSHQPNLAYLPYLVTGDYYYLEELQFWAMWNVFSSNPGYRQNGMGLLAPDQVRGQAWSLRTLAEAAYITPDNDPLKADFNALLNNNLDWYNSTYTNNLAANKLGVVINGYAIVYDNNRGLAPWQDDFFTSAVGHTAELGYEKAKSLLVWKIKFPIDRMIAPGVCWIDAAIYQLTVRDNEASPLYTSMAEAYKASHTAEFEALTCNSPQMASFLGLRVGQMTGYADVTVGYPSNMQPALAYAADADSSSGKSAWAVFVSRSVKPDYRANPQFAVVPR